jgi:4'-phosphopantetheinyl transferase
MPNQLWVRPIPYPSPVLTPNEVHIWLVQSNDPNFVFEDFEGLLSSVERDRASKFKFDTDRQPYVIAHAALRLILSTYAKRPAEELQFASGPFGKPKLVDLHPKMEIDFNLSHSHEVALVAVTAAREIGVDVEWVRKEFAFAEVAKRFFTRREVAALHSLPHNFQREAFYKCWTSKEALLKAKGTGLRGELDEVEILFNLEDGVRVNSTVPNWTLVELNPGDGYVGALAVQGPQCRLQCFQWQG